jgi:hypothetical protein
MGGELRTYHRRGGLRVSNGGTDDFGEVAPGVQSVGMVREYDPVHKKEHAREEEGVREH